MILHEIPLGLVIVAFEQIPLFPILDSAVYLINARKILGLISLSLPRNDGLACKYFLYQVLNSPNKGDCLMAAI